MISRSQLIMPRRRHSVAACPRNPETARRRSRKSNSLGNGAGRPEVSGSKCLKSSAKVGPYPVRRRVCAMNIPAASAHSSAVSSPVKSSNTYAHAAAGGVEIPRHQIGLGSGFTATITIAVAHISRSRDATGWHREGSTRAGSSGRCPASEDCFVWPPKLCHTD